MARTYIYININHVSWPNSRQKGRVEKESRNWFELCISGGRVLAPRINVFIAPLLDERDVEGTS